MLLFRNVLLTKSTGRLVFMFQLCGFRYLLAGYTRDITFDDLSDLRPEDKCDEVVTKFEREWKKELKKTNWRYDIMRWFRRRRWSSGGDISIEEILMYIVYYTIN